MSFQKKPSTKKAKPSLKLRQQWKPLIEKCVRLIILAPPQTKGIAIITVTVKWPKKYGKIVGRPLGFPMGLRLKKLEDENTGVLKYDVMKLLQWFFDNRYINFTAKDLFKSRSSATQRVTVMENKMTNFVDKLLDKYEGKEYNVGLDSNVDDF